MELKYGKVVETLYPTMLGVASVLIFAGYVYFFDQNFRLPPTASQLFAAIVSVGGIAVGFLATIKSILVSIDDREIVKKLKAIDRYRDVHRYIRAAIFWSVVLTVASCAGLLIDLSKGTTWGLAHTIGFGFWIFLTVVAWFACYRVLRVFYALVDKL